MGTLSLFGITILTRSSLRGMLRCMEVSRQYTYSNLVYSALGNGGRNLLRLAIVINNLGLLTAYLIITGEEAQAPESWFMNVAFGNCSW
jgi:amino acid permease